MKTHSESLNNEEETGEVISLGTTKPELSKELESKEFQASKLETVVFSDYPSVSSRNKVTIGSGETIEVYAYPDQRTNITYSNDLFEGLKGSIEYSQDRFTSVEDIEKIFGKPEKEGNYSYIKFSTDGTAYSKTKSGQEIDVYIMGEGTTREDWRMKRLADASEFKAIVTRR